MPINVLCNKTKHQMYETKCCKTSDILYSKNVWGKILKCTLSSLIKYQYIICSRDNTNYHTFFSDIRNPLLYLANHSVALLSQQKIIEQSSKNFRVCKADF